MAAVWQQCLGKQHSRASREGEQGTQKMLIYRQIRGPGKSSELLRRVACVNLAWMGCDRRLLASWLVADSRDPGGGTRTVKGLLLLTVLLAPPHGSSGLILRGVPLCSYSRSWSFTVSLGLQRYLRSTRVATTAPALTPFHSTCLYPLSKWTPGDAVIDQTVALLV